MKELKTYKRYLFDDWLVISYFSIPGIVSINKVYVNGILIQNYTTAVNRRMNITKVVLYGNIEEISVSFGEGTIVKELSIDEKKKEIRKIIEKKLHHV